MKLSTAVHETLLHIANELPQLNINCHEKHYLRGEEILADGIIDEIEGEKIIPEKIYMMRYPVIMAANHYRRLKRAWIKNGLEGVHAYVSTIGEMLRKQSAS